MKDGKEEIKTTVRASQKNMEAAVNSIRSELENTIRIRVEDILASVDQGAQGLQEEVNAKPEEPKPNSHGVTLSFHTLPEIMDEFGQGLKSHGAG